MSWGIAILILVSVLIFVALMRVLFFRGPKQDKPGPENNWSNESYLNVESKGGSRANNHSGAGGIWSGGNSD